MYSEKLSPPSYTLPQSQESLIQIIRKLREREFKKNEEEVEYEWFDYLYQYSTRHNLWNGLMGSRVPNILLGCNNGIGEISMFDNENKWHLNFDMEEFIQEAKQEIVKFLLFWKNICKSGEVTSRIEAIIQEIANEEQQNCC